MTFCVLNHWSNPRCLWKRALTYLSKSVTCIMVFLLALSLPFGFQYSWLWCFYSIEFISVFYLHYREFGYVGLVMKIAAIFITKPTAKYQEI